MQKHVAGRFVLLVLCVQNALAETPSAGALPGLSGGSVAQALLGLLAVLAMVAVAAWVLKRFLGLRGTANGPIRVVAGTAIGQRERIVLVEVGDIWLVVGVAPGQVRTLHTMPRSQMASASNGQKPERSGATFSTWMRRVTERRADD